MADAVASLAVEISAQTDDARSKLRELENLGDRFAGRIVDAFADAALEGRGLRDVLRGLALDLARLTLRQALAPVKDFAGKLLGGALGGLFGFAKGSVLAGRMPVPFAGGGVIAAPSGFLLAGGRLGLAGEAGPEAILPLARGSDGRLGVRAGGSSASANITVNIVAQDVEGFRRSQGQISAMVAKAVARGQRNL